MFLGRTIADTSIGDEPEATDLARWLREEIAKKQKDGLTVGAIASEANVGVPTLYNILNGTVAAPQSRTIKRLEEYFGDVPEEVQKEAQDARNLGTLGEFAQFDPYDETSWPNVPGVYILYDISARPVYIGKSKNSVAARLRDHETRFWFKRPLVTKAAYIGVNDPRLVADLELLLIKVVGIHSVLNQKGVIRDEDE